MKNQVCIKVEQSLSTTSPRIHGQLPNFKTFPIITWWWTQFLHENCKRMAVPILFLIINSCNKLGFNVQNNLDSNYSQQRCYWQFSTCTVYKTRIGVHFYAESQKAYPCWWMNLRDVTQLSSQNLAWWRSDMWYQISKPVFSASLMQGKCKHATTS